MEGPQSNTREERLVYEIEQFLLANNAYRFLHLFLRRIVGRIKSGEIILILAPIDAALERLITISEKTIEQIQNSEEGFDILANHISSTPINVSNNGRPIYVAVNGTAFGNKISDLSLLNYTEFARFENVKIETIDKVMITPDQLDKLKTVNIQLTKRQIMTTNSYYDKLNSDVIRKIALELPLNDILNNCLTSRVFNKVICRNEAFWHEKLRQDYPDRQMMIGNSWKNTYELLSCKLFIAGNRDYNRESIIGYSLKYSVNRILLRIPYINQVTDVATGKFHVAMITNGELYTFGFGAYGQLGLGAFNEAPHPAKVTFPNSSCDVTAVACGDHHTVVICNRQIYTFGNGMNGQLGYGNYNNRDTPTLVIGFDNVTQIACNLQRTAIISNKKVYTFGTSNNGQHVQAFNPVEGYNIPTLFPDLDDVTSVAIGLRITAIVNHNALYTYTNLFNEKNMPAPTMPVITDLPGITQLACGNRFILIIADEQLYSIGTNDHGQLGLSDYVSRFGAVTLVPGLDNVTRISCGDQHSAVIASGNLYTFGSNEYGKLGIGDTPVDVHIGLDRATNPTRINYPVLVDEFERVLTVACGDDRICIVGVADPNSEVNLTAEDYQEIKDDVLRKSQALSNPSLSELVNTNNNND